MDCGAVSDIFARHIPKDFAELHQSSMIDSEKRKCIKTWTSYNDCWESDVPDCDGEVYKFKVCDSCPVPCHERKLKVTYVREKNISPHIDNGTTYLTIYHDSMEKTVIQELAEYSMLNLVADFGGVLGLLVGCSLLSLIELAIMIFLGTLKTCQ